MQLQAVIARMETILTYVAIAGVTIVITLLLLLLTKNPAAVTIGSAFLSGTLTLLYARIDLGYWDPFAPIAFATIVAYACAVSFALLWIGRRFQWPLFVKRADTG